MHMEIKNTNTRNNVMYHGKMQANTKKIRAAQMINANIIIYFLFSLMYFLSFIFLASSALSSPASRARIQKSTARSMSLQRA